MSGIAINESSGERVCRLRRFRCIGDEHLPRLTRARQQALGLQFPRPVGELVLTEEFVLMHQSDFHRVRRVVGVKCSGQSSDFLCALAVSQKSHWDKISDIDLHPCDQFVFDRTRLSEAESRGCQIYRLFIVLFIDGFGVFKRTSHTTDAFYVTLGNLDRKDRHKLENIWCLGMKPPRTKMADCLKPMLAEIKELQQGWYVVLPGDSIPSFVIGSLGVCIADMPQALMLAGCQHQSSAEPCRRCTVKKGPKLGDAGFNIESARRTQQSIAEAREIKGIGNGIGASSPLSKVSGFDLCVGIPTEPMHSENGLCKTLVSFSRVPYREVFQCIDTIHLCPDEKSVALDFAAYKVEQGQENQFDISANIEVYANLPIYFRALRPECRRSRFAGLAKASHV